MKNEYVHTVYITKRIFTQGIIKRVCAKIDGNRCLTHGNTYYKSENLRTSEWFLTLKEAQENANLRRLHEINRLKRKICLLESIKTFKLIGDL